MNNHIRKRISEWILKITSNSTVFGHKQNPHIDLSIDEQIELTTNMETHSDAGKFFNKFNLSQFNITSENIETFLSILSISNNKSHPPGTYEINTCEEYCSGSFHDALIGYRSYHGYISLVVCFCFVMCVLKRKFFFFNFPSVHVIGVYIWTDRKHFEYHRSYTKGHEQNSNKYDTKMACRR